MKKKIVRANFSTVVVNGQKDRGFFGTVGSLAGNALKYTALAGGLVGGGYALKQMFPSQAAKVGQTATNLGNQAKDQAAKVGQTATNSGNQATQQAAKVGQTVTNLGNQATQQAAKSATNTANAGVEKSIISPNPQAVNPEVVNTTGNVATNTQTPRTTKSRASTRNPQILTEEEAAKRAKGVGWNQSNYTSSKKIVGINL
jgi:hypothetical protein